MIVSNVPEDIKIQDVAWLSETEEQRMMDFLQGAVYCWCGNHRNEWFSAREFMGGPNREAWDKTPLGRLYDRHIEEGKSPDDAWNLAGQEEGKLLKKVINRDARSFETKTEALIRQYKWVETASPGA
jgi:hypothetical protein